MEFESRRISLDECLPLRAKVLRPGQPVRVALYDTPNQVHFGAFAGAELVSTVTAHPDQCPRFPAAGQWRIRGMATEPAWQGKGAGSAVLAALVAWGRAEKIPLFWCNAREIAFPFYERHGFTFESELFDIAGIGPHKVMKLAL